MEKVYNFVWNVVMFGAVILAFGHLYIHKQEYLNDLTHIINRF